MKNERKRGEELEAAILEAAYEIIQTTGYEGMTFQHVAKRAETSRTVIYRRYETPVELLHALVRYKTIQALGGRINDLFRDQGSLRANLLALVRLYQRFFEAVGPKMLSAMLTELSRNNEQFQVWASQARSSNIEVMKKIEEYAKRNGEISHEFTTMQMNLPFNLLRFENIISDEKVTPAYLTSLVDEVLMPVLSRGG
ncbi:TetR/AcrR family transcriptional regulator [Cohnella cellulosilytica]|uniref:TetR/AcrR family transcriptional regulator n=1 Tax=Cohnella cellulosilytica TaxID=986710 RepID=A0ABW2F917_9BACL